MERLQDNRGEQESGGVREGTTSFTDFHEHVFLSLLRTACGAGCQGRIATSCQNAVQCKDGAVHPD